MTNLEARGAANGKWTRPRAQVGQRTNDTRCPKGTGFVNRRVRIPELYSITTATPTEFSGTTNGELGFVHSISHVSGTLAGRHTGLWVRWTACFQRIDGVWLVVHDHVSEVSDTG